MVGFFTDAWFSAGRWMVRATSWILSWAFSGGPNLTAPAKQLANAYDTRLIGPLGLLDMALLLAAAWTAWQMMRGRVAYGLSEFALTLVLLAVGTLIARDPVSFVGTAVRESRNLSADVLAISSGLPAGTRAETSLEPLKETVARTFVDQSHDLLNWGSALSGRCAEIRDEILRGGPWGTSETPRDKMRAEPECRTYAVFNADPTGDRLFASMLLSVTAFAVLILILLSAATVLAARYAGDILIAVVGFAAVFALIPGRARALFWRWVTGVVQVAVVILGMAFILSLLVQATQVLLRQPTDTVAEKFGFLLVVVVLMFILRRRILGGGRALAEAMGRKLEAARPRGSTGPGKASGTGATTASIGAFAVLEELRKDATLRRSTARSPAGALKSGAGAAPPATPGVA
ncbi:MAG: type IV secretion system protein, partial [Actinomycetota bacterium]